MKNVNRVLGSKRYRTAIEALVEQHPEMSVEGMSKRDDE